MTKRLEQPTQGVDWEQVKRDAQALTCWHANGHTFPRIPYGEEVDSPRAEGDCHDCGVRIGQYHVPICDQDVCPCCSGQAISCGCRFDEDDEEESEEEDGRVPTTEDIVCFLIDDVEALQEENKHLILQLSAMNMKLRVLAHWIAQVYAMLPDEQAGKSTYTFGRIQEHILKELGLEEEREKRPGRKSRRKS